MPVRAKKKKGRGGDGGAEERMDRHSFAPKAGEAAGLFPEAVLLRKVRIVFFHALLPDTGRPARNMAWFLSGF